MENAPSSRCSAACVSVSRAPQCAGFAARAISRVAQVSSRAASQSATNDSATLRSCRIMRARRGERSISIWLSMSAGSPNRCASALEVPLRMTASLLATISAAEAR